MSHTADYRYYSSCVNWPSGRVDDLTQMVEDALEITRATFLKHIGRESLSLFEEFLGYAKYPQQGLTMAGDWHVRYYRSTLRGETVYFFQHSRIEYVFTKTGQMPPPKPLRRRRSEAGLHRKQGAALV